jgi:proteic killer suppression protein
MDIAYDNNVVRKRCQKATGRLKQRLDELRAADTLEVLATLPGHYHRLSANRSGEWACHLEEPYRLVFRPLRGLSRHTGVSDPAATAHVTICIIEVIDYHER